MSKQHKKQNRAVYLLVLLLIAMLFGTGCSSTTGLSSNKSIQSEGFKEINGTKLYYKSIGKGPPIFVLHGGPGGSHRYFLPHIEALAENHQLIFFDQRGTGLSDGKLILTSVSIEQFVEDIEALRVSFGFEKVSLLGHSWGAVFALFYAFTYQSHLDNLILVAPRPVTNAFIVEQGDTVRQRFQHLTLEQQQTLQETCSAQQTELSPEIVAQCITLAAQLDYYDPNKALTVDQVVEENTLRNSGTIRSLITTSFDRKQKEIEAGLKIIDVSTLIIHGVSDPIPLASSEYIHDTISSSELVVLTESGHFPFVEQPEQFVEAIQSFLQP